MTVVLVDFTMHSSNRFLPRLLIMHVIDKWITVDISMSSLLHNILSYYDNNYWFCIFCYKKSDHEVC